VGVEEREGVEVVVDALLRDAEARGMEGEGVVEAVREVKGSVGVGVPVAPPTLREGETVGVTVVKLFQAGEGLPLEVPPTPPSKFTTPPLLTVAVRVVREIIEGVDVGDSDVALDDEECGEAVKEGEGVGQGERELLGVRLGDALGLALEQLLREACRGPREEVAADDCVLVRVESRKDGEGLGEEENTRLPLGVAVRVEFNRVGVGVKAEEEEEEGVGSGEEVKVEEDEVEPVVCADMDTEDDMLGLRVELAVVDWEGVGLGERDELRDC